MAKRQSDKTKAEMIKEHIIDALALISQLDSNTDPLVDIITDNLDTINGNIEALVFDDYGDLLPSDESETEAGLEDEEDPEADDYD